MKETSRIMADVSPPFTDIEIETRDNGFYEGYSLPIALISKISISLLVVWALLFPLSAGDVLSRLNAGLLHVFNSFYVVIVGVFAWFLIAVAIIPSSGRRRLGRDGDTPEFSTFSWFAMMFGAGLGVGLMVYATAEPLGLWAQNPEIIQGNVEPLSPEALQSAYRYSFMHYGFHAWSIYVVTGLCLAYYAYTRDMPLTIRSALTPIFGAALNGPLGHIVDILGIVATILGVAVTIGYGVSQLVEGAYAVFGYQWLMALGDGTTVPRPSVIGLLVSLVLVMGLSVLSAVSGVGRGVKYLSNLNLILSCILLGVFAVFGSLAFAMSTYASAFLDYLGHFPVLSFEAYGMETELGQWQAGATTFYWAWWIAFSPFVGLFLARISKGRTIREFVLGAVVVPSLVCFAWFALLGGSAIDLELQGIAQGAVLEASLTNKLFATLSLLLSDSLFQVVSILAVVLILTFLVTSADSGILVMNTIMAGGAVDTGALHRIIWGAILTLLIAALILAGGGGLGALQDAMIIGALPFAFVMALMCASLAKALYRDHLRDKAGELVEEGLR